MSAPLLEGQALTRDFLLRGSFPFSARPRLRAVSGISLSLGAGETLGVVGESGSGKSTLALMLSGLLTPSSGEIRIDGAPLPRRGRMPASVRRKIQLVFQDPHASLNPRRTVRQTLLGPLRALVRSPVPDRAERARAALEQVGLEAEFLDRYPHQLSGGQAQRVGIARALSVGPEVVIFDEAVASLDVTTQSEMVALLEDLQKRLGLSYVFISHDLLLVGALAQKVMVLQRGEVVEQGPAAILKGSAKEAYTKSLIDAIPKLVAGPRFALAQRDPPTADHPRRAGW